MFYVSFHINENCKIDELLQRTCCCLVPFRMSVLSTSHSCMEGPKHDSSFFQNFFVKMGEVEVLDNVIKDCKLKLFTFY